MCAQFALKIKVQDFFAKYKIVIPDDLSDINERFLPYKKSYVVVQSKSQPKLVRMNFSLIPSWSKESKVKFATHNARLESVLDKPTWKKPFLSQHCVIPMTSFFESVYTGPLQGHMISFTDPHDQILFAAGIYDVWKNPQNLNEILYSFSILTTEPSDVILNHGHDRSPVFLNFDEATNWLQIKASVKQENELVNFLKAHHQNINFKIQVDRPLRPGWQKRHFQI
jgi:putative SOS response-associated peptidase YedK